MIGKELKVGIGDMKFTRNEGTIITYALGSCIGITFYNPVLRLGALLHIMLPVQMDTKDSNIFKYADSESGNCQKTCSFRHGEVPNGGQDSRRGKDV